MLAEQKLFIDGRLTDAASGETFATINPATGREICRVQRAGAEDVERAVESAARGFATWSAMTGALVADLAVGRAPRFDAARYDPLRFGAKAADADWLKRQVSAIVSSGYRNLGR